MDRPLLPTTGGSRPVVRADLLAEALAHLLFQCGGSTSVRCNEVARHIAPELAGILNSGLLNEMTGPEDLPQIPSGQRTETNVTLMNPEG